MIAIITSVAKYYIKFNHRVDCHAKIKHLARKDSSLYLIIY